MKAVGPACDWTVAVVVAQQRGSSQVRTCTTAPCSAVACGSVVAVVEPEAG